jgi:hypothetical protein
MVQFSKAPQQQHRNPHPPKSTEDIGRCCRCLVAEDWVGKETNEMNSTDAMAPRKARRATIDRRNISLLHTDQSPSRSIAGAAARSPDARRPTHSLYLR